MVTCNLCRHVHYNYLQQNKSAVPLVLIVGYFRSGSTLTGELFATHPRSFYLFEPSRAAFVEWITAQKSQRNETSVIFAPYIKH